MCLELSIDQYAVIFKDHNVVIWDSSKFQFQFPRLHVFKVKFIAYLK